jgi:glucose-6-phosphate 1-dehydrogenase
VTAAKGKGRTADVTAAQAISPAAEGATPATPSGAATASPAAPAPVAPLPPTPKRDAPRTMRDLRLATETRRRSSGSKALENPLREGLRLERVPDPAIFVLFGATGDLAHRKVVPALFQLWRTHLLPHEFTIVAFGRRAYTDDAFRKELKASLDQFSRVLPVDRETWDDLASRIVYHQGDFNDPMAFGALAERLDAMDLERGTRGNRLYYLATQPSAFPEIIGQLGRAGLDHERHEGGWRRVVIEKPFGRDLDSAIRLNREVGKVFRERQVYRIDHYLGKETVRNLLVFRFGNGIFEPIWNRRHIDHVQITVAESIGIEARGAFYEETGASRDFLQNHLLQLLSLVAMEPPATFDADALRDEKVKVIRAVAEMTPDQVRRDVVRGQYGPGWVSAKPVPGYRGEPNVNPDSETETFIAARLTIDDWRWSGIPFYLRMGKRLPKRATEIAIQFKEVPHQLFRDSASDPEPNLLAMRIQPDEGIMLRFGAKVPGLGIDVRNVTMDFTYGSAFQTDSPDAYETLILDAMLGDASLFTRADEVEEAWSIVDPIISTWAEEPAPAFPSYEAGTWGPEAADDLLAREGRRWRRI